MSCFYRYASSIFHFSSILLAFFIFFIAICPPVQAKHSNPFPVYPVIQNNVRFWEKIYSKYSTSEAVIHDKNDLTKIYEVVRIRDFRLFGSTGKNAKTLKKAKNKYRTILRRLARGSKPSTKTERRVAAMVKNLSKKQIAKASNNIRVQVGQKERFRDGVRRSYGLIDRIKRILRANGLPEDLAYLPHVESSYNLNAYSKHGAAGIWQFTRSTGKNYLRIDWVVDERLDPIQSSRAAAVFLKQNYNNLKKWPLAITAYNYGPTGMRRAVKKYVTYEKIFKYYNQGIFKFASRNFYSEFIAARRVAKKLEKKKSLRPEKRTNTKTVVLKGFIDADQLCRYLKIPTSTLKRLNPSLLHPVWTGKKYIPKGFKLALPATAKLKKLIASIPRSYFKPSQKRSRFYFVKKGDTLSGIALRHKISLKKLLASNNLKKNSIIYPGTKLRLPTSLTKTITDQSIPVLAATFKRKQDSGLRFSEKKGKKQKETPILKTTKKNPPPSLKKNR